MANVKVVLNREAMHELLQSPKMQALMRKEASAVLNRCPDIGYGMHSAVTSQRAQATVGTRSVYSERHNNKHNTLLNALGGGGE